MPWNILEEFSGVRKCGQTLSWMFDMSSQSNLNLLQGENGQIKAYKNYAN